MKNFLLLTIVLLTLSSHTTYSQINYGATKEYVAVKEGLNVYEHYDTNSTIIAKLKYSDSVLFEYKNSPEVRINGLVTEWGTITVDNEKGYVINCFLSRTPPPSESCSSLNDYAQELSEIAYPPILNVDTSSTNKTTTVTKNIYKNGIIHIKHSNEVLQSNSLIIPGISVVEAYYLVKNITSLKDIFPEKASFEPGRNNASTEGKTTIVSYAYTECNYAPIDKVQLFCIKNERRSILSFESFYGHVSITYEEWK